MTKELRAERAMVEAKRFLDRHGVSYDESNPGHLKIGRLVNYWPTSGKVFVDRSPGGSRVDRGLSTLEAVLREQGYLRGPAAPKARPRTPKPITPALSGQGYLHMPTTEALALEPVLTVQLGDIPQDHDHG